MGASGRLAEGKAGSEPARPVRAVVLHGPGDVRLEQLTLPVPAAGEVLLEMEVALTGGTVLKTVRRGGHARLGAPPLHLGHEGVGRIAACGAGVTGWRVGERVLPGPSGPCGACRSCRLGREALCAEAVWSGGLFADALLLPARIVAANLHRVPAGLSPERAALADNLACVLRGHERTPGRRNERALVIGTGPLGLLWAQVLSQAGAQVTLAGRRLAAAEAGLAFGAAQAAVVAELAPTAPFDLVIEAVGAPETWTRALGLVARGGRVNFFGGVPPASVLEVDATRLHYEELTLTASFHYAPRHLEAALVALGQAGPWDALFEPGVLPLAELPAWLTKHAVGPTPRKAIVHP